MLPIKQLRSLTAHERYSLLHRFGEDFSDVMIKTVIPIVNDVKLRGDDAVREYTERFDGVRLDSIMADHGEIEDGVKNTPGELLDAFKAAKANIEEFHRRQLRQGYEYSRGDGTVLGVAYQPIDRAAVYVPGGKASYPSSILMGVIPAQIAGCKEITLITPPARDGGLGPVTGAMCAMLGVRNVVKSGGAQGIAAAGLGTESVPKADIIVGPGNVYVTAAKSYLFSLGAVQIDSMAGPSEVLIIADETADPEWVAWDFLSQAEHAEDAAALLVTTSPGLAEKVRNEILRDLDSKSGRHEIKKASVAANGVIIVAPTLEEAIDFSNHYGPEHMQLMIKDPMAYLGSIKNVGSLFLGHYSPVAVGDYYSGTNHILPTGGAARFSSGTSVDTFLRRTTYQMLTPEGLKKALDPVKTMSQYEGFGDKHGGSLEIRFKNS